MEAAAARGAAHLAVAGVVVAAVAEGEAVGSVGTQELRRGGLHQGRESHLHV